ncbi:ribosome small subunit-dependent GTPase [Kosmotoga arenicorallina S304]|uniref:Small ribosomal subunit biogenesis GTPase RsgA n=1 Tax=Kosmotoga arenicorallina S304 TaxID=1453497 RepID=A0A176JZD2_9BACT|nr:ribosome small subunit-dependent GTPase A [Kosmotoga arenicorallina]OAA29428.1 ribosome small subunit-dependent GTPase [Kosmotoga arenicorallina S304]
MKGIVINVQKGLYRVRSTDTKEEMDCTLRGKLFNQSRTTKTLVVVGDYVEFLPVVGGRGVITSIEERKSKLVRKGAGKRGVHLEQIIAANIDQAILVFAVREPKYNKNLIERYIVSAKHGGIEPILCFNKIDLVNSLEILEDIEEYQHVGYKTLLTSTVTKEGIEKLKSLLKGKTSVFAGSSGVGKSSLVNAVFEEEKARTNSVSSSHYKGRHTTTSSQVYELPFGGRIIDVPGMREFGVIDNGSGIDGAFQDIIELSEKCRFRDCKHINEPGCAVKEAVESGILEERRYKNYIKLRGR